ncbi:hypothetical protein BDV10DRAFT_191658 [Aspergillus recurvatus]
MGTVEFLLQKGAQVGLGDGTGKTALHKAAVAGCAELAEVLLQNGAVVDAADELGHSALHMCVVSESVEAMEVLLRYGADVNLSDGRGHTVLHLACRYGWVEAVDVLLENGAEVTIKDQDGLTALQLAKEAGAEGVVEVLRMRDGISRGRSRSPSVYYVRPADSEADAADQTEESRDDDGDGIPIQAHRNLWAGVQRDNGDGFTLARYNNHDISFDAKLESIRPILHEGKDMHEVQIKLNFMRPYSMDHRIRYAKVDVNLSPRGSDGPNIRGIMPQADRMEVSEQEITSGKTFTVGASGNGGPSNVNISMEGSKSKRSTFKGVRIIHGAIGGRMHASWRLYEEPGSRSGLPEIVRLLLLIHCEAEFDIRLALSVKACHFLTFGIPRTLSAPTGPSYTVPRLSIITAYEHSSRLRQMLDVADRAATMIEENNRMEELFSRAMREHKKRHLIMNAGREEARLQEWSGILDDARTSDFTALGLREAERQERAISRKMEEYENSRRRDSVPWRWRETEAMPVADVDESDSGSGPPRRRQYRARHRASISDYSDFTAVGPGYHVSRLA